MANGIKICKTGIKNFNDRRRGTGTEPVYIDAGTGTTTPTTSDTALQTPFGGSRVTATSSTVTVTDAGDTWQLAGTIPFTSTLAITEFGNFDASSSGNIDCHSVFSAYNVVSGDLIAFTLKETGVSA